MDIYGVERFFSYFTVLGIRETQYFSRHTYPYMRWFDIQR